MDGGYALAGITEADGDIDAWLVRTDAVGDLQWNKTYGYASQILDVYSAVQTSDGGCAMAGWTGHWEGWLGKTDTYGNMQWNRTYSEIRYIYSMVQTSDDGYALAGSPWVGDFCLIKTDANGNQQWSREYGRPNFSEIPNSLKQTVDSGYIIAGSSRLSTSIYPDFWVVKTDSSGNMQWNQTYGGENGDQARSVVETSDGGYAIAGYTDSFGAGEFDFWLIKLSGFPTLITAPEVKRLPFRLSFEPVDGNWSKDLIIRFFDLTARPIDMLLKLLYQEPYDQVFGEIWHLPTILLADKNADGLSYDEIVEWLKERILGQLKDRIMEYTIEYYYTITSTTAYLLGYINLENLATALFVAIELTGAVMTAGISISLAPQINVGTTFSIFGIQYPVQGWMETGTWVGPGQNRIYAMSPVDLSVLDGLGLVVNKTLCQISGATYIERDIDGDGDTDDLVTLPDTTMNYSITTEPELGVGPNETFTLIVANDAFGLTLAQDVEIQNITETGYTLQTYDSEFLDSIAQPTPVGGIYIPANKLELLAPYIGLTILLAVAVVAMVYVKKRKRHKKINSKCL